MECLDCPQSVAQDGGAYVATSMLVVGLRRAQKVRQYRGSTAATIIEWWKERIKALGVSLSGFYVPVWRAGT